MSQWSEKIPKENLSKTVSPTRYLFTSFSETWIQINNFRKSSKKFIIDLLTRNIALNLSGAIFFVGLGYSLKWWYKDQLFVVLLKQNLPALRESQQNIYWETGKSILNDEYQTWTPLIDRIDLDANHIRIKFKEPWQKHFYEQFIGVFGEPAQVNISKQILTIPFTGEKDWWKKNSSVINNLTSCEANPLPITSYPFPRGKEYTKLKGIRSKELPDELKKNIIVTKQNFANRCLANLRFARNNKVIVPTNNFFFYDKTSLLQIEDLQKLEKSCDSKRINSYSSKRNLVNKFSTYTLYTQKKPIFPKKLFKLSPHNLCFLNQNSLTQFPRNSFGVPYPLPGIRDKELQRNSKGVVSTNCVNEFLLNTKQRSLFKKVWPLSSNERLKLHTPYPGVRQNSCASKRSFFGAPRAVNWGSWRSKAAKQKDFNKNLTSTDKFSYPLYLTKKLAGWQPFPNLLLLNSYLDEIPYKLENVLQSYFPRKNSQLLFLSTSFRKSINSRNIKELEAEDAGIKAHRGLLYKSKNNWISNVSTNYKSNETEDNETEKTLDLFKEMFLVPGKQNGQSETYLKKLHLFETKKLLQNQLTSLINSFPIDLVEKSKAIVEKDKQSHALRALPQTPYGVLGMQSRQIEDLHDNVINIGNNKSNLFEMNGGLLDVAKKILEVKRNALKKAMDPGVKGQYLSGLLYKSLMCNSWQSKKGATHGINFTNLATLTSYPVRGKEYANGANGLLTSYKSKICTEYAKLCFAKGVPSWRFTKFVPKKPVTEEYWDTEVYRLTQLFAYSTVANAEYAKKLNPLLLLNTLGFTFNNVSLLTNPPILSFSENKINVVDKDINFDKNSRYMSGYIYPDIESNSLKAFFYPWLGKNKNLMLSKPIALYSKNLESNYNHHDSLLQQHKDNLLLSYLPSALLPDMDNLAEDPRKEAGEILLQHENEKYAKHDYYPESFLIGNKEKNSSLKNRHDIDMDNIEIPYKKFNHYRAKFPGFSDPTQFFTTLPQIACGNETLVNESAILGELNFVLAKKTEIDLDETEKKIEHVSYAHPVSITPLEYTKQKGKQSKAEGLWVSEKTSTSNIVDKSEINKKFIQKNGCNSRKVAYSGIVVRRNKKTKDFQPFKDLRFVKKCKELNFVTNQRFDCFTPSEYALAGTNKSSIWGTLFLGPENPLTNRQCHFFGQKQLSTLDTKSLQRDYLRELGKEILTQSNSKGYTELSKFSSIERTKILSLSKKINSFFFKKRKYSYLLEPKDQWHLLFQEQLCSALEDCKKYPLSTIHSFEETNTVKLDSGRIKISAPLVMARFPKKLVQFRSIDDTQCFTPGKEYAKGYVSPHLERGISWRPFCHLQKSFIYTPNSYKSKICTTQRGVPTIAREKINNNSSNDSSLGASRVIVRFRPFDLQGARTNQRFVNANARVYPRAPLTNARVIPHYPLFTERFSEEINALPYLNKNSLFYSATDSSAVTNGTKFTNSGAREIPFVLPRTRSKVVTQKNMKNNLVGVQNMCTSLLIQEPLNCNSWAVLNQWVFLIALLFWIEQTLLNHVFPALFALEQILLSAAGLRTGENNRTHVLRISKNETPKFQNLAGIDGLLGELSELVLFLRGQRNLGIAKLSFWNKWNKKNSYGVLLTGSPGTGKTFLVRALANEANVPVLILSASTLTASKLNNNKPSWSIRHAFKRAKQLAPCILFIDEIDALGKSRGKIVTDINEIVADTNLTSASHKKILTKSTHNNSASLQQMFSYEQFGQNSSNFNATLLNKWEYPLQSTILQESNEINQNSLCQEKLVDLLKIAGQNFGLAGAAPNALYRGLELRGNGEGVVGGTNSFAVPSGKESATEFKENTTIDNKGILPTLEKEMTRGKFGPLTQLLVSMDGVSNFSGVLIMGATNRPELLDPALTRPGRFEKIIRIDKPSEQNRIEILQLYSQNLGVQQQIPWSYLATRTIGLTTADLAVAMNYSSLRAIIQDSVHTLETIEYGLNCITRL